MAPAPRRVAVIGSGVAGLTAAHVAAGSADVTLFESDDRLGGHADTHVVEAPGGPLAIDTGFIVHNERTYPTLLRLFAELGVATQESEMSLSVSDEATGLEYAGALGARGLFPTRGNLRPAYLRMLTEIPRFHRRARAVLASDTAADQTLREFLADGGFTAYFTRHFMEPLVAAVWSTDPDLALDYPARYLFTFLQHHGMLAVFGSPQWRTVTGGSHEYVTRVAARLPDVRTGTKVTSVLETADGVEVTDGNGVVSSFDAVVIATHPAQALSMLASPTDAQRDVLSALPYSRNVALLHTDTSLLPDAPGARASWNFRRPVEARGEVVVTYDLTRLQRLDTPTHYLVTLGGEHLVDPATVIDRMEYEHPLYTPASVAAQRRLPDISTDRVAFAGAYHGWGFHEDGARSGLAAAERLGLRWETPLVEVRGRSATEPRNPRSEGRASTTAQRPSPGLDTGASAPYSTSDAGLDTGASAPYSTNDLSPSRGFEGDARWSSSLRSKRVETSRTGIYDTTIRHTRRTPFKRSFTHRSHTWLVDLDHLPAHGVLARFEARDHLGEPDRSIRDNVEAFLALHDIELRGGQVLMAANARAFGYCFNPISVFWCHDDTGEQVAVLVEVHNTYGDRHAYLVHPDEQGRATTPKQMYVSPFHGTDGTYDLAVPTPGERLQVSVTLRADDGEVFSASLSGTRSTTAPWRAAPAALRGSLLIRAHGIWLWARRLPIRPRPTHLQEGVSPR